MGMGYSTDSRHFIMIKGKVIAKSCHSTIGAPILKMKGKVTLKPNSISVIAVKTPKIPDTNILYEVDSKFQLPEGIIPLNVLYRVDHKTPRKLTIHQLNTSSNSIPISKNTLIGTLSPAPKVENICSINWSTQLKLEQRQPNK